LPIKRIKIGKIALVKAPVIALLIKQFGMMLIGKIDTLLLALKAVYNARSLLGKMRSDQTFGAAEIEYGVKFSVFQNLQAAKP
jgi:hypothetical protein